MSMSQVAPGLCRGPEHWFERVKLDEKNKAPHRFVANAATSCPPGRTPKTGAGNGHPQGRKPGDHSHSVARDAAEYLVRDFAGGRETGTQFAARCAGGCLARGLQAEGGHRSTRTGDPYPASLKAAVVEQRVSLCELIRLENVTCLDEMARRLPFRPAGAERILPGRNSVLPAACAEPAPAEPCDMGFPTLLCALGDYSALIGADVAATC